MRVWFLFIICFSVLFSCNAFSQHITISGYIQNSTNNERLIGAVVFTANRTNVCTTNEQGFYSLTLDKGNVSLQTSYVGFNQGNFTINADKDTLIILSLIPNNTLSEVVVEASANRLPVNIQKVTTAELTKLPVLGGEPDIMKTLQLMPGVQSGSEGHTGLYIKGSEDDQNLVLLDGVTVYNPNHLFGFFSIFNERAIQDITLYKGNFPAKYGGRLSSVIDIHTKEGNGNKLEGSASVGLLASTLNLEGPLFGNKTTFFVSGRVSYLEFFATPIIKHFTRYDAAGYRFYDYNGKITHTFNPKHKLIFSHYSSYDYGFTDENRTESSTNISQSSNWQETTTWGNRIFSLAWNFAISPHWFMNTVANYSTYYYLYSTQSQYTSGSDQPDVQSGESSSVITDNGVQTHLTWYASPIATLRIGVSSRYYTFVPGVNEARVSNLQVYSPNGDLLNTNIDTSFGGNKIHPEELSAYAENEWRLGNHWTLNPGLRYTLYKNHCTYHALEPRVTICWQPGKALINLAYATTSQFEHMLMTSKISQSTDLWVPSNSAIKPERAQQVSVSIRYPLIKKVEFMAEAFYKQMDRLVEYKEGASYSSSTNAWESLVTFGRGKAYGITATLEKKMGKTTGWVTYTLSKSVRKFAEINMGREYPFTYSRPHDFKVVLMQSFSSHLDASATWVFHSGNNQTFGEEKYFGYYLYLRRNGYRLPNYHRLDVNVNYTFGRRLNQSLSLNVYNVYNRKNIYSLEYYYRRGIYYLRERTLFPIIPSLTYRINF